MAKAQLKKNKGYETNSFPLFKEICIHHVFFQISNGRLYIPGALLFQQLSQTGLDQSRREEFSQMATAEENLIVVYKKLSATSRLKVSSFHFHFLLEQSVMS